MIMAPALPGAASSACAPTAAHTSREHPDARDRTPANGSPRLADSATPDPALQLHDRFCCPSPNGMAAPTHPTATPAVATAPRHPIAHTGNTVRYTNAQTARTRDSRTKLSLATALLSLTHALSSQRCCNTFCHQMPCKHASRTQHSATSLHLFQPVANSAHALKSAMQICKSAH